MKKLAIIILVIVALAGAGLLAFKLGSPEIVVENASASTIREVVVELPSNRVVFGEIQPGSESTIYYSATQGDGVYAYSIEFAGAPKLVGSCGYVTGNEIGKRLHLVIETEGRAVCRESNKIF